MEQLEQVGLILSSHEFLTLFVCAEILRPSQLIGVMSSPVSLPNLLLLGRLSSLCC